MLKPIFFDNACVIVMLRASRSLSHMPAPERPMR